MPKTNPIRRRDFLITAAPAGAALITACRKTEETSVPVAPPRSEVPLRVLLWGTPATAQAIRTAWGGVSNQPLAIETFSPFVTPADGAAAKDGAASTDGQSLVVGEGDAKGGQKGFAERAAEALTRNDLAVIPCGLVAELSQRSSIVSLAPDLLATLAEAGPWLDAIEVALVNWVGKPVGVPLGSPQPALMIAEGTSAAGVSPESPPTTWDGYIAAAKELGKSATGDFPKVAEPLAGGDAAKSFLWRAIDAGPEVWLFDRETFEPVLESEAYVRALETMRACAESYGGKRLTAGEVWAGVADGRLAMAIGWPALTADVEAFPSLGQVWVGSPPRGVGEAASPDTPSASSVANWPILTDPEAPLGVISGSCRQTAAAKRFLGWLAGGDGSELVRGALPGMTVCRKDTDGGPASGASSAPFAAPGGPSPAGRQGGPSPAGRQGGASSAGQQGGSAAGPLYDNYLKMRLRSSQVRPTLRLLGYDRYLAALDRAVIDCLDGKVTAAEGLAQASAAWKELTKEYGREGQAKVWRYSQGLRF